ncbi:hypothetical protein [Streptomyces sp. NPDC018693]|uniref:hypothetical protein n=1 Tax=unclassified Streptomyces TaxID=2593676 RepID=UPI0037A43F67
MSAEMIDAPLGLSCNFTRGTRAVIVVDDGHNPQLARELLTGLLPLIHPHGRLDSQQSIQRFTRAISWFTAALADEGYTGGAAGLTRARLAQAWWGSDHRRETAIRKMLAAFDDAHPTLAPEVREFVDGRVFNYAKDYTPLVPYDEGEWQQLEKLCRGAVKESYAKHRQAMKAAEHGRDPVEHGWTFENVCWLLARKGPVSASELALSYGWPVWKVSEKYRGLHHVSAALFPDSEVVIGYQLLFSVYTGIVPDGIGGLDLDGVEWAGDSTILLSYLKGRTAAESLTLNRRAVRLLEQWFRHSAPLREFAPEERRGAMWLRQQLRYGRLDRWQSEPIQHTGFNTWLARQRTAGAEGLPKSVHRHRIRTTFESLRDRQAWFGSTRATVDPNHSPQIEGDRYLATPTAAQSDDIDTLIETAQADLLRKAHPPQVMTEDEIADFAGSFPQLVKELELDDAAIAELTGGQRDVFVAACADPLSGQHGPAGKPCPARPWVCLLCPLAVFAPRHTPNLLRLNAYFARQWQQMQAAHFMAVFGPYAQRIDEVLDAFRNQAPDLLVTAAAQVADTDDELPLLPEERTA